MQLTADFDFNRITQTTDKFDPEGRVVRSSQTREETLASSEAREGQVTVGNELPGAGQNRQGAGAGTGGADNANKSDNRKSEEIVNYEISRTTKTEVIEGGRVNRVSVAVLVDGTYAKNDKGEIDLHAARKGRDWIVSPLWCAPPSASTRSAATRLRSSICASPKRRKT